MPMPQMMPQAQMNGLMTPMSSPQRLGRGVPPGMIEAMTQQHAQTRAQLDKLEEQASRQRVVREQLNHLKTLGDLIDEEDVVKSASKIVAAGAPPMMIASLLADMPSGAEALREWIVGQEKNFAQKEAQMNQVLGGLRHQTGLAALRLLAAESFGGMAPPGAPPQSNSLMPQTPALAAPAPAGPTLAPSVGMNALTEGLEDDAA